MGTGFIAISLCCWAVAAQGTANQAAEPSATRDAFHVLVELVGDPTVDAIRSAEAAHAQVAASGKNRVPATYALALVYTHEHQFDQAVKTLDKLPNEAKLSSPILRLRLYLALERDEQELAERLVPLLVDQVTKRAGSDKELSDTARYLGGILGAIAPGDETVLSNAVVDAATKSISAVSEAGVSGHFRLAYSESVKRREKLAALTEGAGDKQMAQAKLNDAQAEQAGAAKELKKSRDDMVELLKANGKAHGETTGKIKVLGRQVRELEREWTLDTPGRPRQPVPPIEPREPKEPRGANVNDPKADADYKRDMDKYRRDFSTYRDSLRTYQQDVLTYPQRLARWQESDRMRRENLTAQRKKADNDIAAAREADKERNKKADDLRDEIKKQQTTAKEFDLKVQLLQLLAAGNAPALTSDPLARPSHYGLLSFTAERQRLLQTAR